MRLTLASICCGLVAGLGLSCDAAEDGSSCGPSSAVVARVIDGDTVELDDGQRVRYLLVDTPEVSGQTECFGPEAEDFNRSLVEGQRVDLFYDEAECTDRYGRLLAFVEVQGRSVNRLLLERGLACVLYIPPGGEDRVDDYEQAEATAQAGQVGMWGACENPGC